MAGASFGHLRRIITQELAAGHEDNRNVIFAAGVIVCPGVTIGEGAVVGAGSVVTRDLPARNLCLGGPCRAVRVI